MLKHTAQTSFQTNISRNEKLDHLVEVSNDAQGELYTISLIGINFLDRVSKIFLLIQRFVTLSQLDSDFYGILNVYI